MSNILKIKNTMPGNENYVKTQTSNKPKIAKEKSIASQGNSLVEGEGQIEKQGVEAFYQSNFGSYVKLLQQTPELRGLIAKFLLQGKGDLEGSIHSEEYKHALLQLMSKLKMTKEEAVLFLKNQVHGGLPLHGGFFDILRQTMNESSSIELRSEILEFTKKYCDRIGKEHILKEITFLLGEIKKYMFQNNQKELQGFLDKLIIPTNEKGMEDNIRCIKQEIIPYLGSYISATKNLGKIRDLINVMVFNFSRYENGTFSNVLQSYDKLLGYQEFHSKFKQFSKEEFSAWIKALEQPLVEKNQEISNSLLEVLNLGVKGEAGHECKRNFLDILQAFILNESVYMPLLHFCLPIEIQGHMIFSQLWVKQGEDNNKETLEQGTRIFLKFELETLGIFDMILYCKKGKDKNKVSLQLYYPEVLSGMEKKIEAGIKGLVEQNNLVLEGIRVEKGKEGIKVEQVFEELYERRYGVNVRV